MSCKIEMRRAVLLNVCPLLYAHAEAKLGTFAMEFEYQHSGRPSNRALNADSDSHRTRRFEATSFRKDFPLPCEYLANG